MKPTARTERELGDLHPDLERRVRALITACPHRIGITSAWRSRAEQQRLYDGWKQRLPGFNPANPPGRSKHEDTIDGKPASNAADLNYSSVQALAWAHQNASEFGLCFPIRRENWHVESNGKPYREEFVMASKAEVQELLDEAVLSITGGVRPPDRKDADLAHVSNADLLNAIDRGFAAVIKAIKEKK